MVNVVVSVLYFKFVVKKKKVKVVKVIKQELVDLDFDEKKEQIEGEVVGNKVEKKIEEKKDVDGQMKEVFDKMCDKLGMMFKKVDIFFINNQFLFMLSMCFYFLFF